MKRKMGLLVMAYGTPYQESDIERYYTHIRRGRKPSQEMLKSLADRYEAIGGISPLAHITKAQADRLAEFLNKRQDSIEFKVYLGLKHIDPFIEDAVKQMHEDGIEEAVSIVLAPHFSTFSIQSYNGRAIDAAKELGGPSIHCIESWYQEPKFIQYWTEKIKEIFSKMPEEDKDRAVVIFSAHSLPQKITEIGDPYPEQLRETAHLIAEHAGLAHYTIGWQSAGRTPEPWLGPDVKDLTRELYETSGFNTFVYVPVGFVSDHLEVLYDNDYECRAVTEELGAAYYRPEMPNTQPLFIDALADTVWKKVSGTINTLDNSLT